ncbi:MAG: DNA polymerase III subunit delta [Oscillospiraceae bacterium]|nr:DNA polymerase III subunit delta [Oscillospiraceae bacterium]
MNYTEFTAEIKAGLPKSLYILTGEEDYLKEHSVAQAKKRLIDPGLEDFNFQSYSEMPDFTACNSFVNTLPMMSERKLLVLRNCGFFEKNVKQKADWEEMFTKLPEYICVLLWEGENEKGKKSSVPPLRKVCEKIGIVVEFSFQTEAKLIPWLAKAAAGGGKLIDRSVASYIISSLGRSMSVLKTEMQKIVAYAHGEQITRDDVDAVIVKPTEDKVYKLIDAIMDGRRDLCYAYLYDLRQNRTEPIPFLGLFSGRLVMVYHARLLLDEGLTSAAAAKALGGGWLNEKSVRIASRTNDARLERLIDLCRGADRSMKQGRVESWAALEMIVTEMRI